MANPQTTFDPDSIQRKLKQASELYSVAYSLKQAQVKRKHPEWSEDKIHQRVRELIDSGLEY